VLGFRNGACYIENICLAEDPNLKEEAHLLKRKVDRYILFHPGRIKSPKIVYPQCEGRDLVINDLIAA